MQITSTSYYRFTNEFKQIGRSKHFPGYVGYGIEISTMMIIGISNAPLIKMRWQNLDSYGILFHWDNIIKFIRDDSTRFTLIIDTEYPHMTQNYININANQFYWLTYLGNNILTKLPLEEASAVEFGII